MDESTLAAIHRLLGELTETKEKIKDMRDNLKDVMLQNAEYQDIQEELKQLTAKRVQARKLLEADRDYQTLNSELQELRYKQKDLIEIMSHHLVTHYADTQEGTIRDPEGEIRQLLLHASLGKPEASFGDVRPSRSRKPLPGQVTIQSEIEGYGKLSEKGNSNG